MKELSELYEELCDKNALKFSTDDYVILYFNFDLSISIKNRKLKKDLDITINKENIATINYTENGKTTTEIVYVLDSENLVDEILFHEGSFFEVNDD